MWATTFFKFYDAILSDEAFMMICWFMETGANNCVCVCVCF